MWRVIPGQLLAFREWDGEAVLYNDLSGSTHLLDAAAIDVLQLLARAPQEAAALAAHFGADADADADDLTPWIEDLLAQLARFDLVEYCPC